MSVHKVSKPLVLGIMAISIVGVIVGFKYILPLFLPFVFGYFVARLAAPIVTVLALRCRIPRGISSIIVVITFLFIIGTSLFFLGRAAFFQMKELIANFPVYEELWMERTASICLKIEGVFGLENGTIRDMAFLKINQMLSSLENGEDIPGQAINAAAGVAGILWNVIVMLIAALLLVREFDDYKESFQNSYFYKEIHMVTGVLSNMGIAYLKAQLIMMCIIAGICVAGLLLIGNRYALIVGIGIAVFDAFPVLGSAFILIPWCIILLFEKRFVAAIILGVTYIICQLTRQMLEPKLVGDRIGIQPVYTLISMYVGLKIYGAVGFILGPISLVAMKAIVSAAIGKLKGEQKQSVDKTGPLA